MTTTIQTRTVEHRGPLAYSDKAPWTTIEPVVEVGDRVEVVEGMFHPAFRGEVTAVSGNLIWVSGYPYAAPGFGPGEIATQTISVGRVQKIERGEETWVRA